MVTLDLLGKILLFFHHSWAEILLKKGIFTSIVLQLQSHDTNNEKRVTAPLIALSTMKTQGQQAARPQAWILLLLLGSHHALTPWITLSLIWVPIPYTSTGFWGSGESVYVTGIYRRPSTWNTFKSSSTTSLKSQFLRQKPKRIKIVPFLSLQNGQINLSYTSFFIYFMHQFVGADIPTQDLFSHSSESCNFKVKVLLRSTSCSHLGLQVAALFLCPHTVFLRGPQPNGTRAKPPCILHK